MRQYQPSGSSRPVRLPRMEGFAPRPRPRGGSWFDRIFILPHAVIGLGMIGYTLLTVTWLLAGEDTQGRVVAASESVSTKSRTATHRIEVAYDTAEGDAREPARVSDDYWAALPPELKAQPATQPTSAPAVPIVVRQLRVAGFRHVVVLPEPSSRWTRVGTVLAVTVFWNVVVSLFVYRDWIVPLRRWRKPAYWRSR